MRLILLFAFFISSFSHANTSCIGPQTAKRFYVYLHGMDTPTPSKQELANRAVLSALASKLNIRFALPRADEKCPSNPNLICWTWSPKTTSDLHLVSNALAEAAQSCFSSQSFGVLGFSNGGIAASAFLRLCENNSFKSLISVGGASGWYSSDPQNLRNCSPKLVAMVGSKDFANQKPIRDFVSHLKSVQAPVELVEYEGGHELVESSLLELLKKLP